MEKDSISRTAYHDDVGSEHMTDRTDRLLAILVLLVALLLVSQVTVVPRNELLGAISMGVAVVAILYALGRIADTLR